MFRKLIKRIKSYVSFEVSEEKARYINFCLKKLVPFKSEVYARESRIEARTVVLDTFYENGFKFEKTYCDSFFVEKKVAPFVEHVFCIITLNIVAGKGLSESEISKITQIINDLRIRLSDKGFDILEWSISSYPKRCNKYKYI